MNAEDQAIKEVRDVRHRLSAEFDHDIEKYVRFLRDQESQHEQQIRLGDELLAQRKREREKYGLGTPTVAALNDKPKS